MPQATARPLRWFVPVVPVALVALVTLAACKQPNNPMCGYVRDTLDPHLPPVAHGIATLMDAEAHVPAAADVELAKTLRAASAQISTAAGELRPLQFTDAKVSDFHHAMVSNFDDLSHAVDEVATAAEHGDYPAWELAVAHAEAARKTMGEHGKQQIQLTKGCEQK